MKRLKCHKYLMINIFRICLKDCTSVSRGMTGSFFSRVIWVRGLPGLIMSQHPISKIGAAERIFDLAPKHSPLAG